MTRSIVLVEQIRTRERHRSICAALYSLQFHSLQPTTSAREPLPGPSKAHSLLCGAQPDACHAGYVYGLGSAVRHGNRFGLPFFRGYGRTRRQHVHKTSPSIQGAKAANPKSQPGASKDRWQGRRAKALLQRVTREARSSISRRRIQLTARVNRCRRSSDPPGCAVSSRKNWRLPLRAVDA